ncbi:hepatitis A virus cellular receptor 1 homolog isoform X2 [Scleropages formosus]|uniref:hepatitis A virus cellular receptor 1 homolog isoform X2 n=1 Tax=Scleropages formosus TaxID=113540 RepID=UPI0008785DE3|nr:hepatitis A virus cellular receptor 1 homolog isoform X2 [Scleropages formosus]
MGPSSFVFHGISLGLVAVCNGYVETVIGVAGERVTLPCGYSVKTYGVTDTCWGRGEVPYSKCSKMVVSTEGDKVTYRQSDRYKLLGRVRKGNVSLTIINATEADTGIYGCRVEVPGLFNDLKYNVLLLIGRAPVVVTGPPVSITGKPQSERAYWDSHTGTTDWDGSIGTLVQMQA